MEHLGLKLRQQRHKLGLTLDDLAARTAISKPYLSLIETGRVPNPPSDDKLRRLEETLNFSAGELLSHANLFRTPLAIRAVLGQLLPASVDGHDDQSLTQLIQQLAASGGGKNDVSGRPCIPVINGESSGYPRHFNDLNYPLHAAVEFVACPGLDDSEAFAVRVHGDRMTPRFFDGDIVIFSPAAIVRSGDDCFVRFEDGNTAFARVFFETDHGRHVIRLQPRNEKHRPQVVAKAKVGALYRAVSRQHRLDDSASA